jgi:IS5 family transposase
VLLEVALDVPDHTTLSRRSRALRIKPTTKPSSKPIQLIIDATGLKAFGQGEWARAKHGSQATHTGWRKLHLGVDSGGFIVTAELTDSDVADATAFPGLVRKVKAPIKKVTTDGSYDHRKVWQLLDDLGAHG